MSGAILVATGLLPRMATPHRERPFPPRRLPLGSAPCRTDDRCGQDVATDSLAGVRRIMKDLRFDTPIFTIAETHRHLAIPASTVARWMTTEVAGKPLVHRLPKASP